MRSSMINATDFYNHFMVGYWNRVLTDYDKIPLKFMFLNSRFDKNI